MENEEKKVENTYDFDKDVKDNKVMAILAYFIFFLPLIAAKDSKFARFHANQGLIVLIVSIAASIVGAILSSIIPFFGMVTSLASLALAIFGVLNAANGEMKELPVVGKISIIK